MPKGQYYTWFYATKLRSLAAVPNSHNYDGGYFAVDNVYSS